jgi:non-heme chloroperoxidase
MIFVVRLIMALALGSATSQDSVPFRDMSPHRAQFVSVQPDVQLEVLDWGGSGRALVFLAGYQTAHAYDEIAPKLTDVAHVYGITRRGLGASSKPHSGHTAKDSAADVVHVLDNLNLEKPVMAGHSFGGQDLSVVGAAYPDRISALVYLDSAEDISLGPPIASGWPLDNSKLPEALREERRGPDMRSFTAYREWQRNKLGMAFPEAELRHLFAAKPDGTVGEYLVSKEVRDAMFAGQQAPDYSRIRVPVLAFFALPMSLENQIDRYQPRDAEQGAALGLKYGVDLAWVARNRDALKRGIPNARVVEISEARTYIWLSNEADVLRELRQFLARLSSR